MRQKIRFLKMVWRVLITKKEQGWIFFKINSNDQEKFLNNQGDIEININYLCVDERVIKKLHERIENPSSLSINKNYGEININ